MAMGSPERHGLAPASTRRRGRRRPGWPGPWPRRRVSPSCRAAGASRNGGGRAAWPASSPGRCRWRPASSAARAPPAPHGAGSGWPVIVTQGGAVGAELVTEQALHLVPRDAVGGFQVPRRDDDRRPADDPVLARDQLGELRQRLQTVARPSLGGLLARRLCDLLRRLGSLPGPGGSWSWRRRRRHRPAPAGPGPRPGRRTRSPSCPWRRSRPSPPDRPPPTRGSPRAGRPWRSRCCGRRW
jgi:hypothetical protein